MKYFKDQDGNVFAFEADGSQDAFIPKTLIAITEQVANDLRFPPPTPDQLRAIAIADIEQRRDDALRAGIVLDGTLYHSDDRFLTELLGMVMGYQAGVYAPTDQQGIRTMDNTVVQLGAQQITALASAVGAHRRAVYAQSWAEKDAL